MAGMRAPQTAENREGLAEYAVRWNWVTGPSSSGFTAVLRVMAVNMCRSSVYAERDRIARGPRAPTPRTLTLAQHL